MKTILLLFALSMLAFADCTKTVCTVCPSGCDYATVQAALDGIPNPRTQPQVIELTAGATYAESITLRSQATNGYPVIIRSSKTYALSPLDRIVPATDSVNMARILAPINYSAMQADEGASYYQFDGIEFTTASGTNNYYVLMFGNQRNNASWFTDNEPSKLQHHIWLYRCWIHGINTGSNGNFTACINAGTKMFHMENSVLSDCYNYGNKEAHGFQAVNGMGPFYITNTQLSASQIGSLFGGGDPSIRGLIATGLFFTGNYYYRPWLWRVTTGTSDPTGTCNYDANGGESFNQTGGAHSGDWWLCTAGTWINQGAGTSPQAATYDKNHFEIKSGINAWADGNYLANGWYPTLFNQRGDCFLFNQVDNGPGDGNSPWATEANVYMTNNVCTDMPSFTVMGVLGSGYYRKPDNIVLRNNIANKLCAPNILTPGLSWPCQMQQTQIGNGRAIVQHNTLLFNQTPNGDTSVQSYMNRTGDEQVHSDNVVSFGTEGYLDQYDGNIYWGPAIAYNWPTERRSFSKNIEVNDFSCVSRFGNNCAGENVLDLGGQVTNVQDKPCVSCAAPADYSNVFTNMATGDYTIKAGSPYQGWGHYMLDPGADVPVVTWSTQGAVSGAYNPYLAFRIRALVPASTTAAYTYTAPSTEACTITVAGNPAYSTPAYNSADAGGNPDRTASITGLTAHSRYWWKVVCGASSYRRSGVFNTP